MSTITVSKPSDLELIMSRTFDAPRELVFAAHTQAEHLKHWWGRGNELEVQIDFRVGGAWRFVEPLAGHIAVEHYVFTEDNGRTTVTCRSRFDSKADRDGMIESGMEEGAEASYRALDAFLNKIGG